MGSIPIFQMNLSALDGYISPGLLEAIFGFALTISRKLFVARYGRGMGTSLHRSSFKPTGGAYMAYQLSQRLVYTWRQPPDRPQAICRE